MSEAEVRSYSDHIRTPLHEMCNGGSLQFWKSLQDYILHLKLPEKHISFSAESI